MVIAFVLVLLFAAFFAGRRHMGPGILAAVAGTAVYTAFYEQILGFAHNIGIGLPDGKIKALIALILIVGFPMILYFKSPRGGMFGLLRVAEALIMAALLTAILAPSIAEWFAFDDISKQILGWINNYMGFIMATGIGLAYLDILFYRS